MGNIGRWPKTLMMCPDCGNARGEPNCGWMGDRVPVEVVPREMLRRVLARAEHLEGAVDLLLEAREWIDNAGDFMARPMDLLARIDATLSDHPAGQ